MSMLSSFFFCAVIFKMFSGDIFALMLSGLIFSGISISFVQMCVEKTLNPHSSFSTSLCPIKEVNYDSDILDFPDNPKFPYHRSHIVCPI